MFYNYVLDDDGNFINAEAFRQAVEMHLEINFTLNGKKQLLEPASDEKDWFILTDLSDLDHPVFINSVDKVLNYRIGGKALRDSLQDMSDIDC